MKSSTRPGVMGAGTLQCCRRIPLDNRSYTDLNSLRLAVTCPPPLGWVRDLHITHTLCSET